MTVIEAVTLIDAPIEDCFRLSLDISLEQVAAADYGLSAIGGVTHGPIGLGERVTWQTRQFGFTVRHTTEITALRRPVFFEDSMIRGIFRSYRHQHFFESHGPGQTRMRDHMQFGMPWFLTGVLIERLLVRHRMQTLLALRNAQIKKQAEQGPRALPLN